MMVDDEMVSSLVSLFFTFLNPYWRFVEQDLFIRAMRAKIPSAYCSSLLVYAILAYSQMFSEITEAYTVSEQQSLVRGHDFFQEALRLWEAQHGEASITTIQAGIILSIAWVTLHCST